MRQAVQLLLAALPGTVGATASAANLTDLLGRQPAAGQYETTKMVYEDTGYDAGSTVSRRNFVVVAPSDPQPTDRFPIIAYAHGAGAGGALMNVYDTHFHWLASYGFVVVAPDSCTLSCGDPMNGGWELFKYEQLRGVDFARNKTESGAADAPWARHVDWDNGIGVAGHSMGGTATLLSSFAADAERYRVRAAAYHQGMALPPFVTLDPSRVTVPLIAFTGGLDVVVTPAQVREIYAQVPHPKTFRDQVGTGHMEPCLPTPNHALAAHTAAFFKIWIYGEHRGEYHEQIYGSGPDSVCSYAEMRECESYER